MFKVKAVRFSLYQVCLHTLTVEINIENVPECLNVINKNSTCWLSHISNRPRVAYFVLVTG